MRVVKIYLSSRRRGQHTCDGDDFAVELLLVVGALRGTSHPDPDKEQEADEEEGEADDAADDGGSDLAAAQTFFAHDLDHS